MAAAGLCSRWLGLVVVALGCAHVPFATGSHLAEASSKDSLLALLRAGEVFCVGPTTLELHPDVGGEAAGVDLDFGDEEVVALSLHAPRPRRSLHEHHAHTGRHASPHVNVTLAMRCDIPPVPSAARGAREYAAAENVSRGDDESVYAPIARDVKLVLGGEGVVEADDARRRRDILPRGSFHGQDSAHVGATSALLTVGADGRSVHGLIFPHSTELSSSVVSAAAVNGSQSGAPPPRCELYIEPLHRFLLATTAGQDDSVPAGLDDAGPDVYDPDIASEALADTGSDVRCPVGEVPHVIYCAHHLLEETGPIDDHEVSGAPSSFSAAVRKASREYAASSPSTTRGLLQDLRPGDVDSNLANDFLYPDGPLEPILEIDDEEQRELDAYFAIASEREKRTNFGTENLGDADGTYYSYYSDDEDGEEDVSAQQYESYDAPGMSGTAAVSSSTLKASPKINNYNNPCRRIGVLIDTDWAYAGVTGGADKQVSQINAVFQVVNFLTMRHSGLKVHFRIYGIVLRRPFPNCGSCATIPDVPAGSCLAASKGTDACGDALINSFRNQWRGDGCGGNGGKLWVLRQLYNNLPLWKQGMIGLFTGRAESCGGGPAGIAYVNGICTGGFKFGAMRGDLPSLGMMAALVTHEFGHLMDGRHTQDLSGCSTPEGPKWIMSQTLGSPPDHRICWENVQRMEVATRRSCVLRNADCINCRYTAPNAHTLMPNGLPRWIGMSEAQRAQYRQGVCWWTWVKGKKLPTYAANNNALEFAAASGNAAAVRFARNAAPARRGAPAGTNASVSSEATNATDGTSGAP